VANGVLGRIEGALAEKLEEAHGAGIFPAGSACVGVFSQGEWRFIEACVGSLGPGFGDVDRYSVFDLASLTKPWVAIAALRLHQSGRFGLDTTVAEAFPEARSLPVGDRPWEEVLTHRAGLAAWAPFYEAIPPGTSAEEARERVLRDLLRRWEPTTVGSPVYSDLGYILTGFALERLTGVALHVLVAQEVSLPCGIAPDQAFFAAAREGDEWKAQCASTGWSPSRSRNLRGEVHDDNCAALGGVSGHAGMFGTALGVAKLGTWQVGALHGRRGALEEELVRHAVAERAGGSHRLGWDGKAEEDSAAGELIDAGAFGHLGFTGTSVWCDPSRQLVIVLLTNRVAVPGNNEAIRAFRPSFHDTLIHAYDGF